MALWENCFARAGEMRVMLIEPHFDSEISALSALRDKPAGTVRITTVEHAAETILWPAMAKLLAEYPDVNVEIISDYRITDIVADRYDAGVRLGEQVDRAFEKRRGMAGGFLG